MQDVDFSKKGSEKEDASDQSVLGKDAKKIFKDGVGQSDGIVNSSVVPRSTPPSISTPPPVSTPPLASSIPSVSTPSSTLSPVSTDSIGKSPFDSIPSLESSSLALSGNSVSSDTSESATSFQQGAPIEKDKRSITKKIFFVSGIFLIAGLLLGFGVWGYTRYEAVYVLVDVEKILPKETDLVARVMIQENSQQVQLLENTARKIPGYDVLRKSLDEVGEGKDVDETFLDAWENMGINFDKEVLPVLGNEAWVVVPDLHPVEQMVGKELGGIFGIQNSSKFALGKEMNTREKVLGRSTRVQSIEDSQKSVDFPALDFIVAAPITDMQEALRVMEKIKSEGGRFQITGRTYKGYSYLEVFDTEYEAKEKGSEETLRLNIGHTYYGILGSNWMVTSHDDWMKEMIDRRKALALFSFFDKQSSLEENEIYRRVMTSLRTDRENLLSVYYKWNTKNSCGESEFCSYGIKDLGMQEGGFSVHFNDEGVLMRTFSSLEGKEFKQTSNKYSEGLARVIPKTMDNWWADVYFEIPDGRGVYYDFKRNYLTDRGLSEWNDSLDEIQQEEGVHLERDFIDHLMGDVGVVVYTSKSVFPGIAMIVEMEYGESFVRGLFEGMVKRENDAFATMRETCKSKTNRDILYCSNIGARKAVMQEKEMEGGKIYRIQEEGLSAEDIAMRQVFPYELCGAVSTGESRVIFASSCSIAQGLTSAKRDTLSGSLSVDAEYDEVKSSVGEEGFFRAHIVPLGLVYSAMFMEGGGEEDPEMKEVMLGVEGFAKTLRSITVQNESRESSTMFLHIKELPQEEKERSDAAMEKIFSEARMAASEAVFKARVSAITPEAIVCCDEGGTLGSQAGEKVCPTSTGILPISKDLKVESITYSLKKDCDTSGNFEYEISVLGAGACSGTTKLTQEGAVFPEGCE